ncbi:WD40 repeat domain-containing protein [Alkalinema pantanalense CENA528]|uniref:WD40 repeat domain-containing protein n=1 Tax=Alkalinema pantanalense TaxID=1620705 RepID=UPI003D6E6F6F
MSRGGEQSEWEDLSSEVPLLKGDLGGSAEFVERVVRERVIDQWEAQDLPPHLKTIRDRLLRRGEERMGRLLGVYQQVLAGEDGIAADESEEQLELRLTGLVVKRQGRLRLYNRIYGAVFDGGWVDRALGELRPYGAAIAVWLASAGVDESRLLRGQALQDARDWAEGKRLGDDDYRFLDASQELERREMQTLLAAEQEANQILTTAREQAETELAEANQQLGKVRRWTIASGAGAIAALVVAAIAVPSSFVAKDAQKKAETIASLERSATASLKQFEFAPFEALISSLKAAQKLQNALKTGALPEPTMSPQLALHTILTNIRDRPLYGHQGDVLSVVYSPDGKSLATRGSDGTARVWNLQGQQIAELKGHQGDVLSVVYSPDGKSLATRGSDGTARVWNLQGQQIAELKGHQGDVLSVVYSPDGKSLATRGIDGTARVWNLQGQQIAEFQEKGATVSDVTFAPNAASIAIATSNGRVLIYPVETLEQLLTRGCDWADSYLVTYASELQELTACQTPDRLTRAANYLISQSEKSARKGNLNKAIEGFTLAKQWKPDWPEDPKQYAEKLAPRKQ